MKCLNEAYDGARMRSISEKAEINKGLLHYYFKSKEALTHEGVSKNLPRNFRITWRRFFNPMHHFSKSGIGGR